MHSRRRNKWAEAERRFANVDLLDLPLPTHTMPRLARAWAPAYALRLDQSLASVPALTDQHVAQADPEERP